MLARAIFVSPLNLTCHFPGRNVYRLAIASWVTLALNQPLFHFLPVTHLVSTGVLLWLINALLVYLLTPGKLFIPGCVALVLAASASSYFLSQYGIVIDREMLQNALETDPREASEIITPTFIVTFLLGASPLLFIGRVCRGARPCLKRVAVYSGIVVTLLLVLGAVTSANYQEYAGFFRQNKRVKHMATPLNVISASESYVRNNLLTAPMPFREIALTVSSHHQAPEILVIVVGETARADHFIQNGYERNTTPQLNEFDLINFSQVTSCGTATAHSLPCMFSWIDKDNYSERMAMNSENVFDILARGGINTVWFDNNSGCKGLCERMPTTRYFMQPRCKYGCTDNILSEGLNAFITKVKNEQLNGAIILHQQGSQGPAYYKRSRQQSKLFMPECTSDTFADCSAQQIINAYDNSLVETGALLAEVIRHLKQSALPASMLYISDHGESLGENGVYLHGLPYWMALKAQTHVPMILWMSQAYSQHHQVDTDCLRHAAEQPQSHDMLFSSILAIAGVRATTTEPIPTGLQTCLGDYYPVSNHAL